MFFMCHWMVRPVALACLVFCLTRCVRAEETPAAAPSGEDTAFVAVPAEGTVTFRPTDAEEQVPEPFRLAPNSFEFEAEFERMSGPVRVYKVRFPSPVETDVPENNTVHGHYFQPPGEGPHPGCVVLHILGGQFALSQMSANTLARRGVGALFIKMPYYGERRSPTSPRRMVSRDPHETVAGMTQAVLDIRRAAAWLGERPEIDADRLGVTGISLGGIMSALSAAGEPRFKKVAIYLGGGNLGTRIWEFDRPDAEQFRREWLAAGGTRESFLETLAPIDPCTHGHLLKDRTVLMVAAKNDEVIPPESTRALWESIGKPELVWLDAGHITAARYLYGEMERLGRFFETE
jgi:cephalosporin-C deacetylase-like acetyl esterase